MLYAWSICNGFPGCFWTSDSCADLSGVKTTFGLPGIITTTGVVGGVAMGCYGVNKAEVFN